MLFVLKFTMLLVVINHASGQTCLSNEAKEDFDKSRQALTDVQENIGKVTNKLEDNNKKILGIFKDTINTMGQKIKKLDTDLKHIGQKFENDNKKTLVMFKGTLNTMGQKIKKLDTDFKVLGEDFRKTKWHKYNGHCYYYSSGQADWFMAERKCREIGGYIVKIDDKEENSNIAANRANSGPVKRPLLTRRQRQARLQWSLGHRNRTLRQWRYVHWSDKKRFHQYHIDECMRVWHSLNTAYRKQYILGTTAFGGYHYWIGLTDLKEGKWRWTYDQSKASFTTWYPGHGAKGTDSNCVILHHSRTDWFDHHCNYSAYYICESNFCF